MNGKMIVRWIGLALGVVGGLVLGIGITTTAPLPPWWYLISLMLIGWGLLILELARNGSRPTE